jgi:glucose/arabinose dehydrogenase
LKICEIKRKLEKTAINLCPDWISILSIISLLYLVYLSPAHQTVLGENLNQTMPHTLKLNVTRPLLVDDNLKVELVARDLDFPTSITFVGKDDILLLEKNTGNVYRIIHGNVTGPLIHIDVSFKDERGLLGVAISKKENKNSTDDISVFLYYTQCTKIKGQAKSDRYCGNYIYKYELDSKSNKLIIPSLLLNISAMPGPSHNGGVLQMDKEKNLYVTIGDIQPTKYNQTGSFDTTTQNLLNGSFPDGRAGILRLTQDGKPIGNGILGDKYPLNLYYAYGIKNSFGMDFDPLTGNLWDTENGPQFGDEINLVKSGFNSGWEKVQGIWKLNKTREKDGIFNESGGKVDLVNFDGKGKYSRPEFVWDNTVAPTALVFLASDKLGKDYRNDILVGSVKNGTIYHFDLNKNRKSLSLEGGLADLVVDKKDKTSKVIVAKNFGIITDLKVGPDGYLYVVSGIRGTDEGAIFRIVPK